MLGAIEREEICGLVETLRGEVDDLVVRGLRTAGPAELRTLDSAHVELTQVGATHLAERVRALVEGIRGDTQEAPGALMQLATSLRVFERVLTLDQVAGLLEARVEAPSEDAHDEDELPAAKVKAPRKKAKAKPVALTTKAGPPPRPPPPPLTLAEGQKLLPTLEDLIRSIDSLVGTGLTTASEATRQKLDVVGKEALRLKLARLGAALRFVNEEVGRFLGNDESFSKRRLSFFLHRAWLIAHGLGRAIRASDADALARLLLTPPVTKIDRVELTPLGVSKRIVKSTASCAFEFRFRVVAPAPPLREDQSVVWSCLFAYDGTFPPEAFLQLPQPQGFAPRALLDRGPWLVQNAAVALDEHGGARLMLGPPSTITPGQATVDPTRWTAFDRTAAAARLRAHRPGPLDIEVELLEEVVLEGWTVSSPVERAGRPDQRVYPVRWAGLELDAVVSTGSDGQELTAALDALAKPGATRPPLFGLVHYELCRLILQPLSLLDPSGPRPMTLAFDQKFDQKTLADLTRALMNRR